MRKLILVVLVAVGIGTWFARPMFAQPAAPAKPQAGANAGQVDPNAVLKQMADYLGKLPAFSCKAEAELDVAGNAMRDHAVTKMTVRLARPNQLAMIIDEGTRGMTTVSDGKQLTHYMPLTHKYVVQPAPADFAGITDIGAPMPITMLGVSDVVIPSGDGFYKSLMDGVTKSEYLGQEKVGDAKTGEVMCHHCRFIEEEFDWDIWIEVGNRPVVHKVQPDLAKQVAASGPQFQGLKVSYVVTLSDWNVAPKFTAEDFTFTPPAGAEKSDSLFETPEEPVHPLLGEAAPAFTTTDVDGHPIDLKVSVGKNVILLDFWATWCGPCVQAMPQVDEVAKKYKAKGLVFYAVNVGEDAETIKKFLAEAKLDPTVALNTDNKISEQYKVEGIPQTLLIGKDGKVQVVHVGFSPQLGKMLTSEIEDLLAGKDLAKAALAKAEESRKKHGAENPAAGEAPAPGGPGAN